MTLRTARSWRIRWLALWSGLFLLAPLGVRPVFAGPLAEAHYALGQGLHLPELNLTLSGYSSLRASAPTQDDDRLDLRDLSLFTRWEGGERWFVFSELEFENLFVLDGRGATTGDIEVALERLYVEWAAGPVDSLRAGRYLTPFGRWNQIHADPLVWTVSRPLVTMLPVPDHGTGAMWLGSASIGENSLDYLVYLDDSEDLDPAQGKADFEDFAADGLVNDFERAAGAQLRYHLLGARAEIAASYVMFRFAETAGARHAFGMDGLWRWRGAEFSGEAAWQHSEDSARDDWGGFVQAVVPLVGRVYGITRLEHFRSGALGRRGSLAVVGLTYRPRPALSFKAEYQAGDDPRLAPDVVQMSFSVLF